jgi:hypothetical protein
LAEAGHILAARTDGLTAGAHGQGAAPEAHLAEDSQAAAVHLAAAAQAEAGKCRLQVMSCRLQVADYKL